MQESANLFLILPCLLLLTYSSSFSRGRKASLQVLSLQLHFFQIIELQLIEIQANTLILYLYEIVCQVFHHYLKSFTESGEAFDKLRELRGLFLGIAIGDAHRINYNASNLVK